MNQETENVSKFRKGLLFLKNRYHLKSDLDIIIVFIQFAITGSSAVRVGRVFLDLIGVDRSMSPWLFWPIRIVVVFIIYQLLFMAFGFLLGQWKFTKWFSNKMLSRFGIKFLAEDEGASN